jgi:hypothetical protein
MGLFAAWAIGESIVFYRWGKLGAPPTPGVLAASSALFGALAVISIYQPARVFATVTAFGLDLAILMQVIGKAPAATTGWPPPLITDINQVMPGSTANTGASTAGGTATTTPAKSGGKPWYDILNPFD